MSHFTELKNEIKKLTYITKQNQKPEILKSHDNCSLKSLIFSGKTSNMHLNVSPFIVEAYLKTLLNI